MRALVITGAGSARVEDVEVPVPGAGQVVVDVRRAGICGTDVELFTGQLAYFAQGKIGFPIRPGHEWCGVVSALGDGVDPGWLGARVTGDTMLGCGHCPRCAAGRGHVCADRREVGIVHWPGALAEKVLVRASSLYRLPDAIDDRAGALVEPGGNGWRAASAAHAGPGKRILVCGPGTIGLLTTAFATAMGAEVHIWALARDREDWPRVSAPPGTGQPMTRRRGATTRWSTAPTITGCPQPRWPGPSRPDAWSTSASRACRARSTAATWSSAT